MTAPFPSFQRVILAGRIITQGARVESLSPVFVNIKYGDAGRLSITGVVGPKSNGDSSGSCGQIVDVLRHPDFLPADGIDAPALADLWDRWHLNDMRAGCTHQRDWDTRQPLTLTPLTWGPAYRQLRDAVTKGTASPEQYATYQRATPIIGKLAFGFDHPQHPDAWGEVGQQALADGWVVIDTAKVTTKAAGWVNQHEHPAGLLSKPCPTCGHKYGHAWLREDVPDEVLATLRALPETTLTPAWV